MRKPALPQTQRKESFFEVVPERAKGRTSTTSIALPSSILANAQSPELRIYLAGQIARAAAIYCVDEIVIFEEEQESSARATHKENSASQKSECTSFFKIVLEYLETPQYLRRHLIPMSQDLRLVGLLNPLGIPSHVSRTSFSRWREGVAVGRIPKGRRSEPPPTRYVDVGLHRLVEIDKTVLVGARVTVDMSPSGPSYEACPGKYLFGTLVGRDAPRIADGLYWGYKVRTVAFLSDVFSNSSVCQEYDLIIGTSERGTSITGKGSDELILPDFSHALIVFGGVYGLERSISGDEKLEKLGFTDSVSEEDGNERQVGDLFDYYLNTCPCQGSRTIRSEEAILISLAALQPHLHARHRT